MRHRKHNVGLNRTAPHRKSLLMNLTHALVTHKRIVTTLPKARAARQYAEKLITFARRDDVAARRHVLRKLHSRDIVNILFNEIGPKFRDRNGGYTRIIKMDPREGDNAPMAILELIGFAVDEPAKPKKKRPAKQKKVAKPAAAKQDAQPTEAAEAAPSEADEAKAEASAEAEEPQAEAATEEAVEEKQADTPAEAEEAKAEATPEAEEKQADAAAEASEKAEEPKAEAAAEEAVEEKKEAAVDESSEEAASEDEEKGEEDEEKK